MATSCFAFGPDDCHFFKVPTSDNVDTSSDAFGHLPKAVEELFTGPNKAKTIYQAAWGEKDSYYIGYKDSNDNNQIAYNNLHPRLTTWLKHSRRDIKQIRVTLGPNSSYFAIDGGLFLWDDLNEELSKILEELRYPSTPNTPLPKFVALGKDKETYILVTTDAKMKWRISDCYEALSDWMESEQEEHSTTRLDAVQYAAFNLHYQEDFLIVFKEGGFVGEMTEDQRIDCTTLCGEYQQYLKKKDEDEKRAKQRARARTGLRETVLNAQPSTSTTSSSSTPRTSTSSSSSRPAAPLASSSYARPATTQPSASRTTPTSPYGLGTGYGSNPFNVSGNYGLGFGSGIYGSGFSASNPYSSFGTSNPYSNFNTRNPASYFQPGTAAHAAASGASTEEIEQTLVEPYMQRMQAYQQMREANLNMIMNRLNQQRALTQAQIAWAQNIYRPYGSISPAQQQYFNYLASMYGPGGSATQAQQRWANQMIQQYTNNANIYGGGGGANLVQNISQMTSGMDPSQVMGMTGMDPSTLMNLAGSLGAMGGACSIM